MLSLLRKLSNNWFIPTFWTAITIFLLCLPGSSIPGDGFFPDIKNLDKVVHMILFGGIVLFWGSYTHQKIADDKQWFRSILSILFSSMLLGVIMEYIQYYFIPLRSFDKGDILADIAGSLACWGFLIIKRKK